MAMAQRFQTYAEFWPFYLHEHAKPRTRAIHYVGTLASTVVLMAAVASQSWWWLLAVPFFGYGPAWLSHFFVEKNKPATFQAPLWSLISDYRMCGLFLTGRLGDELMKHQVRA
ncbi:Mpo1-like protein [Reyranella sp.]|uniref:Mpo1-like protein n=1 Tax=Reyranella sp. TaxID=1929291 RepID=UPI003784C5E1